MVHSFPDDKESGFSPFTVMFFPELVKTQHNAVPFDFHEEVLSVLMKVLIVYFTAGIMLHWEHTTVRHLDFLQL